MTSKGNKMLYPKHDCILYVKELYISTNLHGVLSQIRGRSAGFTATASNLKKQICFELRYYVLQSSSYHAHNVFTCQIIRSHSALRGKAIPLQAWTGPGGSGS